MAEGVLKMKVELANMNHAVEVDSAGTISMHQGEHPDSRAISTAKKHGVDISKLVARQFTVNDFDRFDKIIVMDASNYTDVIKTARNSDDIKKVKMLLNYSNPDSNNPLPDPYFGGIEGFERVYQMIDKACDALIISLEKEILQS